MDRDRITEILDQTLADQRLSRGERHALEEVFVDLRLSESERAGVRNLAFERAAAVLDGAEARATLDWLRDVIKALDGATRGGQERHAPPELLCSPGDTCRERICGLIRGARTFLDICVFTITDDRITREIVAAHERGVRVRVISDDDKSLDLGSDIERLAAAGVPTALDHTGHMHHKFAVFDHRRVVSGSYNWTRSAAAENHENILVTDDPVLAEHFLAEFERLWTLYAK